MNRHLGGLVVHKISLPTRFSQKGLIGLRKFPGSFAGRMLILWYCGISRTRTKTIGATNGSKLLGSRSGFTFLAAFFVKIIWSLEILLIVY